MAKKTNKKNKTNKNPYLTILKHLCVIAVLALVLIFGAKIFLNLFTRHGRELVVPDFSNLTVLEAEHLARKSHLRVAVTDSVFLKRMKKGAVYRQSPLPGSHVKKDKRITLTINANIGKMVTMPDLVGLSMRQAKAELLSRGLVLGKLVYVQDMATNNVLKQIRGEEEIMPGTMIESETVIDLLVGLNGYDATTYVPDVKGLKRMSAVGAVHDNSLNIRELRFDESVVDYDDSLNAMVWRQTPEPSDSVSVAMGSDVVLYLTLDEHKIPVKEEIL